MWKERLPTKGLEKSFWSDGNIYILIVMVITLLHALVKTHRTEHLK